MAKRIERLKPYNQPPTAVGTTIISVWDPAKVEATHIFADGQKLVWPFPGAPIGDLGPEKAALSYLFDRDYVGDTIFVVGDPDA